MTDYQLILLYGYRVVLPQDTNRISYRNDLYSLNGALPEPFRIMNLLSHLPMNGEYTDEEYDRLDRLSTLWVGFVPSSPEEVLQQSIELRDFLEDNVLFDGVEFEKEARFHCGVEWFEDEEEEDEEDDDEEDDDEENEDEEDSEEDEEEEEEDEEEDSEEDEEEDKN